MDGTKNQGNSAFRHSKTDAPSSLATTSCPFVLHPWFSCPVWGIKRLHIQAFDSIWPTVALGSSYLSFIFSVFSFCSSDSFQVLCYRQFPPRLTQAICFIDQFWSWPFLTYTLISTVSLSPSHENISVMVFFSFKTHIWLILKVRSRHCGDLPFGFFLLQLALPWDSNLTVHRFSLSTFCSFKGREGSPGSTGILATLCLCLHLWQNAQRQNQVGCFSNFSAFDWPGFVFWPLSVTVYCSLVVGWRDVLEGWVPHSSDGTFCPFSGMFSFV